MSELADAAFLFCVNVVNIRKLMKNGHIPCLVLFFGVKFVF